MQDERGAESARRVWYALDVQIEPQATEAIEYALMEAGALGTEINQLGLSAPAGETIEVTAYFDTPPERERVRLALLDALRLYELPTSSAREMNLREVEDRDWLGEWKKSWQPVRVGARFIIAPPWSEIDESAEARLVIRIEPGMAFGTGTHETTRLCLEAIEKYFTGRSFLDVGTGTGILSIAAALVSPNARIEACDTDPQSVEIASENARLNGVADRISFHVGTVDEQTASADFVCANLTADVIVPLLPGLISTTCGRLVLSGILESQTELLLTRLRELGVTQQPKVTTKGEWIAIIV